MIDKWTNIIIILIMAVEVINILKILMCEITPEVASTLYK